MGWLKKLKGKRKLVVVREMAKFAFENMGIPGGGLIAGALDSHDEIKDEKDRERLEKIVSIINEQHAELVERIQSQTTGEGARDLEEVLTSEEIQAELSQMGQSIQSEIDDLKEFLSRDLDEIKSGMDNIDSHVGEVKDLLDQLKSDFSDFVKKQNLPPKASLADSLSIRPGERGKVKEFLSRLREIGPENMEADDLTDLGRLLTAARQTKEATEIQTRALSKTDDGKKKAQIHYNLFVNFLEEENFEEALREYKLMLTEADDETKKALELFPSWRYDPICILGAGGFGVAFLCEENIGGKVVVKSLLEVENSQAVIDEAANLNKVESPYVIKLSNFGYVDDYTKSGPYLAMEYLDGEDLSNWFENRGVIFSPEKNLKLARAIALGMKAAHEKNIIHRDLKPDNVLYREEEKGEFQLKIIDFGLAMRDESIEEVKNSLKESGEKSLLEQEIAGTLHYAPPEQLREIDHPVGTWSDVYSYGLTLKTLIFGRTHPSSREIRDFPHPEVIDLISDCEERDPKKRLQNFDEVLDRLDKIQVGELATSETVGEKKKSPAFAFFGVLFALLALSGAGMVAYDFLHRPEVKKAGNDQTSNATPTVIDRDKEEKKGETKKDSPSTKKDDKTVEKGDSQKDNAENQKEKREFRPNQKKLLIRLQGEGADLVVGSLEEYLLGEGFRLIDAIQLQNVKEVDAALAEGDSNKLAVLKNRYGIDVILSGHVHWKQIGDWKLGTSSPGLYTGQVTLRAIRAKTGEILFSRREIKSEIMKMEELNKMAVDLAKDCMEELVKKWEKD